MSIFQSLIYGLVVGISEFLPISSQGHSVLLKELFGVQTPDPFRSLLIHISMLLAVLISCGTYIQRLRRDQRTRGRTGAGRSRNGDKKTYYDLRFVKTAAVPMLIGSLLHFVTGQLQGNLALVALFFALNGIAIYAPEHLPHSNKDSSRMSGLDGILVGISGALAVFPGFSRIGMSYSCAVAKGADKEKALNWVLVLLLPAFILLIVADIIQVFTVGFGVLSASSVIGSILSALMAFGSACGGIYLMRFLTSRSGITSFGFYCWGAALLSLILYLTA